MTPLAQRVVRQLTLPLRKRNFADEPAGTLRLISEAHCFECSAVLPLADDLMDTIGDKDGEVRDWAGVPVHLVSDKGRARFEQFLQRLAFLPAPVTWIEYDDPAFHRRIGLLLTDGAVYRAGWITVQVVIDDGVAHAFSFPVDAADIQHRTVMHMGDGPVTMAESVSVNLFMNRAVGLLALINTPRIIGRRQHLPHAGLQRALARSHGAVGKYPLHAWHEIVLEVSPTAVDDGEHEARLTGSKALHFCRAHLRLRNGRVELVRAHWRGDPALGIKRSRYMVRGQ